MGWREKNVLVIGPAKAKGMGTKTIKYGIPMLSFAFTLAISVPEHATLNDTWHQIPIPTTVNCHALLSHFPYFVPFKCAFGKTTYFDTEFMNTTYN